MFNKLNHFPDEISGLKFNITNDSVPWFLISLLKKYEKVSFICQNNNELYELSQNIKVLYPQIRIILFPSIDCPLFSNISPKSFFKDRFLEINLDKKYSIECIKKFILGNDYYRVETVRQKGEYAIRGGIIDIFSPSEKFPIRLDTFGSEIETMKVFDPITQ